MEFILQDRELASLLSVTSGSVAVYILCNKETGSFIQILPFDVLHIDRKIKELEHIPNLTIDKMKSLLLLGVDRFTAFELIKPYMI